jgi:molybdopterin converting factor subunit 1
MRIRRFNVPFARCIGLLGRNPLVYDPRVSQSRSIKVLYFGGARDAAGRSDEELELPDGIRTIAELSAHLATIRPGLADRLSGVRFAIDEAFVDAIAEVHPGAVVAVIPPVSGG